MEAFGQVITEARKKAGLTQEVAEQLRREDGRKVLPPFLNDLEHDQRYPPENTVIEQLARILQISSDVLYFYAKWLPSDMARNADGMVPRPGVEPGLEVPETSVMSFSLPGHQAITIAASGRTSIIA
jgi:transcriptional regulator with XRE-family HTH domain